MENKTETTLSKEEPVRVDDKQLNMTLDQLLEKFTNLETKVNTINKQIENTFTNKIDLKENPEDLPNESTEFELG